ncbi:MAG: hypothetical protein FJZ01_12085 [Candidatus Sericytochromatia bacterium]|nr:hypothetical protein [Candidatus Tanganyikabacteria bacterium]
MADVLARTKSCAGWLYRTFLREPVVLFGLLYPNRHPWLDSQVESWERSFRLAHKPRRAKLALSFFLALGQIVIYLGLIWILTFARSDAVEALGFLFATPTILWALPVLFVVGVLFFRSREHPFGAMPDWLLVAAGVAMVLTILPVFVGRLASAHLAGVAFAFFSVFLVLVIGKALWSLATNKGGGSDTGENRQ